MSSAELFKATHNLRITRSYLVRVTKCSTVRYLYGASALIAAASSGSHLLSLISTLFFECNSAIKLRLDTYLSPFARSFSLLYNSSSLVSVAYSALGASYRSALPSRECWILSHTLDNSIHWTRFFGEVSGMPFQKIHVSKNIP